jgi:hypothetical protein
MAQTRWRSSIYTPGSVVAGYYGNVAGTAYMLMTGLGTSYKMTAGTAQLTAGSVNVTTGLPHIVAAVANCANHLGTAGVGIYGGTLPLTCVFLVGAGTMAVVHAAGGTGITGTAYISWQAVGYS